MNIAARKGDLMPAVAQAFKRLKSGSAAVTTGAMLALLAATGCATNTPTANIVRFHNANAPEDGAIAVSAIGGAPTLETTVYVRAVEQALAKRGFTPTPASSNPGLAATFIINTMERDTAPRSSGLSVGLGGGFGSGNVGLGGSVSIPVGKKRSGPSIRQTTLTLRIHQQSAEGPILWEGRATAEGLTSTPAGQIEQMVPKLADALLADYPGVSARTTNIKLN